MHVTWFGVCDEIVHWAVERGLRFGSARVDERFARKNEAVQEALDGDMADRRRDQRIMCMCQPSVECDNRTRGVHTVIRKVSGRARYPATPRTTIARHSSREVTRDAPRHSATLSDLQNSEAARWRSLPSHPTSGQPFGKLEYGGRMYRPSQLPGLLHVRSQMPNTLQ